MAGESTRLEYARGLEIAVRRVCEALLSLRWASCSAPGYFQAKSLACTLDAVVHETKAHLVTRSGHYNLQLAIAC